MEKIIQKFIERNNRFMRVAWGVDVDGGGLRAKPIERCYEKSG